MMNNARPLSNTQLGSAIGGQSRLRPSNGKGRRSIVQSLMLTSLVDAFSILVIFLIINTANSSDVVNLGKVTPPVATESQLIQTGTVVRVEGGQYIVEDKPVALSNLASTLKQLNTSADAAKKEGIIIVADKNLDYEALSPVIMAGSNAGFTKFKFAVVKK